MLISAFIVDDEASSRERVEYLLNQFLTGKVYLLGSSNKPQSALEIIPRLNPDIAFLDVEMPGMSGIELCTKLRVKGYKGKIVFVTAFDHYSVKAIRAEAFDYIVKPVDVDELKEMINRFEAKDGHLFSSAIIENFDLSEREVEIITYLSKGLSSEETASEMFLSRHTIDTHRRNIHLKTGTKNTIELLNLLRG